MREMRITVFRFVSRILLTLIDVIIMVRRIVLFIVSVMVLHNIMAQNKMGIPTLDEMGGDWIETSTLQNFPSLTNFIGGLQSTHNVAAFQNFTTPPFSQMGPTGLGWDESLTSTRVLCDTMPNWSCELRIAGKSVMATESKWSPHEIIRKVYQDEVNISSVLRMPFEQEGVLLQIVLENRSKEVKNLPVSMLTYGRVRYVDTDKWNTWGTPRPYDDKFVAEESMTGKDVIVSDQKSAASVAYSFVNQPERLVFTGDRGEAFWNVRLAPGEKMTLKVVYAVENQKERALAKARRWASGFDKQFSLAKEMWEERWQAAFTPNNTHFSGNFPMLETNDQKIRRVYYMGALTSLCLCRTNMPISTRFFPTAGPRYATTIAYFWDVEMWANTWAMLEPITMKEQIIDWFTLDWHNCYAIDGFSKKGAGPWYAANDWSIFRCIEAYLGVTGDNDFLNQQINGKTLLQHLEGIATYFESRPLTSKTMLADYGGSANLLECSPSYIQGVPSLNAANVYMLKKTSAYYAQMGDVQKAKIVKQKADKLLLQVMRLYEKGEGVWNAMNKEGKKVPVRPCYDSITIGQALEFDLTKKMKTEMNNFVESELLTSTWMRAMSLKDPAAKDSDRPDHGPMGSYAGWPPMTMDVMCRLGDFDKALAFLRATEQVSYEASWAQAHEFITLKGEKEPIVRASSRGGQDALEGCGTAFMEVVIRAFFGFRPDLSKDKPVLLSPDTPRGFNGVLRNIPWKGGLCTVISNDKGVNLK